MSIFRRNRLSDEQLRELLQSLPQMKAPDDFDAQLDRMVSLHSEHVPHMLGSMPMVPAPDDFDARLMEAIRDNRRRVAPLPAPIAAGGVSINWLNHIMGWLGGSLAVVALAFFIHQPSSDAPASSSPTVAVAPTTAPQSAVPQFEAQHGISSGSVGAPYGVTILQTTSLASAVRAVGKAPVRNDAIALNQPTPAQGSRPEAISSPIVMSRAHEPATVAVQPHTTGTPAAVNAEHGTPTTLSPNTSTGTTTNVNVAPHTDASAPVSTTTLEAHDQHGAATSTADNDTSTGASDQQIVNTGGDRPSDKDGFRTKTNP